MAINLLPPLAEEIFPVTGIVLGTAEAGIQLYDRKDVLLMELAPGAKVAGVFTTNRLPAAPVQVCRAHLKESPYIRAVIVNTGCANSGTGVIGLDNAKETCERVADIIGCGAEQVLPFSTGPTLEYLPMERLAEGIEEAYENLSRNNWIPAAEAIMTTDSVAKAASKRIVLEGVEATITGISKGSGRIEPHMATSLAFIATDLTIGKGIIQDIVKMVADASYNRITVDGETSTNDSFILISSGRSPAQPIDSMDDPRFDDFLDALIEVAQKLAQAMVRDGEGATKFVTIDVSGARTEREALKVAYAVGKSVVVKTAFADSDPNPGRILSAIGNSGIPDLVAEGVNVWLDDVLVIKNGTRAKNYREDEGTRVMEQEEITVTINLGRGEASETIWTTDLSHEYIELNSRYGR